MFVLVSERNSMLPVRAAMGSCFFGSADLLGELQSWRNPWPVGQEHGMVVVPPAAGLQGELLW